MKAISVSPEVFAEIWKRHKPGDATEDDILRHEFRLPTAERATTTPTGPAPGYEDSRFGVVVPEGFEIFRIYKGKEYRAKATGGKWLLDADKRPYPSLHKLSWAVVQGHENSWYNWKYLGADGEERFIHSLRDTSKLRGK